MPTVLPMNSSPRLEDAVGAAADVLGGDAGQLRVVHRQHELQHAVRPGLGPHAEVDEVVPVERRQQERRRHAGLAEERVGLALGVEVRHLVLAHAASACASSSSGTIRRVSSSVDQMTCRTPAALAACARLRAWASSFSGEKCSQKLVTQYAPYAPCNARSTLAASSRSAATTSAPAAARARALSESTWRVTARTAKPPSGSSRIARDQAAALRAGGAEDGDEFLVGHGGASSCRGNSQYAKQSAEAAIPNRRIAVLMACVRKAAGRFTRPNPFNAMNRWAPWRHHTRRFAPLRLPQQHEKNP